MPVSKNLKNAAALVLTQLLHGRRSGLLLLVFAQAIFEEGWTWDDDCLRCICHQIRISELL